jgi:hypothetical protein
MLRRAFNSIGTALFVAALLGGCGAAPIDGTSESGSGPGTVVSDLSLGKVGALAKPAAIDLRKLVVTLVSGNRPPDTLRDTSSISGNAQINVSRSYDLKPLRTWTRSAKTLDTRDSVIHQGSTAPFYMKPGDTVQLSLNMASRFSMYEANFNDLPDSVGSSAVGTAKEAVRFKRVVMKVDGVVRGDSTASAYFSKGQQVKLAFDYITPGTRSISLEAHGNLNSYNGLLYSGSTTFDVAAGSDESRTITLDWAGPVTGTGKITVTIGKVGKVVINGALPGTVFW